MKQFLIVFICLITTLSFSQDGVNEIKGNEYVSGLQITDDFWFDYEATIKYRLVLFGGVKFDVNVTNVRLSNIRFDGEDVPDAVFEALNLKRTDFGGIIIDKGLYDVHTDVEFQNCFFESSFTDNYLDCTKRISDIDIIAVGWGSIDEYTYLEDEKLKTLKAFFNITKPDDFYTLDAKLVNPKITKFNLGLLYDIKNEMYKLKSKEELIAQKLKELKALQPNRDLTLEKLKYKKQLLKELIDLEVEDCLSYQSCEKDLKEVKDFIKNKFGVKGMSEEEAISWIRVMLEQNIHYDPSWITDVVITSVDACNIKYKFLTKQYGRKEWSYYDVMLDTNLDLEISQTYVYSDNSEITTRSFYAANDRRIEKSTSKVVTLKRHLTFKKMKEFVDVLEHLASFCKKN